MRYELDEDELAAAITFYLRHYKNVPVNGGDVAQIRFPQDEFSFRPDANEILWGVRYREADEG